MKNRIHWIDVLKGLGIYFVILGHTIKNNDLLIWIYSFHMPLFFFISGYLSESKKTILNYKSFFLSKCKSLLFPFIFFRILLFLYWFIVEQYFRQLDLGPIWFLLVLFGVEIIITPILLKWNDIYHNIIIAFISLALFYILSCLKFNNEIINETINWLERITNSGLWFSIAFIIRKIENTSCKYKHCSLIFFCLSAIISITCFRQNGEISMFSNITNNILLYIILGLSGIYMIMYLCRYVIKQNVIMEWFGYYTIVILAIHEPIKRILLKLTSTLCNLDIRDIQSNLIYAFIISFITIVSCVPIISIFIFIKNKTGKIGKVVLCFIK